MERNELERLDREALIALAEEQGIGRARILTRPELVDELLMKTLRPGNGERDLARARGLFGRARDLIKRVVDRGLHLPDAADRLRAGPAPLPLRSTAAPLPTVTLAEIYAAQGHRERAIETLRSVLAEEPDHAPARALLERLADARYEGPARPSLPVEEEPAVEASPLAVDEPPPARAPADECVAIPVAPGALFVRWAVSDGSRRHQSGARPTGGIALRILVISPGWDGPRTAVRDAEVSDPAGEVLVRDLPAGAVVRAAIGWRAGEAFFPLAHSPALEAPRAASEGLHRWTLRGRVPVSEADRDAEAIAKTVELARTRFARAGA